MSYLPPKTIMEIVEQQEISTDDILSCMLSIRPLEVQTYLEILTGANTVQKIAKQIQRTNSTVHRLLNQLMSYGLITRHLITRDSISRGDTGYYYAYEAAPPEKVRDVLLDKLDRMYDKMRTYLIDDWLEHIKSRLEETTQSTPAHPT
jgi:predicted transcriptional regulator